MNDINEMPPKCQYCPYWEVCEYPWVCPDKEQLVTDTISRQAAIDIAYKYKADIIAEEIEDLPFVQPEIIHCRDCKHKYGSCCDNFAVSWVNDNDFCSRAERREESK